MTELEKYTVSDKNPKKVYVRGKIPNAAGALTAADAAHQGVKKQGFNYECQTTLTGKWKMHRDTYARGRPYYMNDATGETTWNRPAGFVEHPNNVWCECCSSWVQKRHAGATREMHSYNAGEKVKGQIRSLWVHQIGS